ncbi:MAG: ABC transporter ATP-binding protein [Chloroflexi bacterium]|nr:ABC transporter ATP-binding protein [Chloroflexota bacterium]
MSALLKVDDVAKTFGGVHAVDGVSFEVDGPSVLGLIGPNGSGKTTLLSIVAGTYAPTRGQVTLESTVVSGRGAHRTVHAGIVRTFQTTRLLGTWTLRESMQLASNEGHPGARSARSIDDIAGLLHLSALLDQRGRGLTSAQQRMAMIAVALSTAPKVLLLDEPAVGMDLNEALALAQAIRRVRDELRVAVIVVDHNMHFLMPLAEHVLVMAAGRVLATGTPLEIRANQEVIASYLGA